MIETDLFKTKREQIIDFIKTKRYARTSEIMRFGLSIYYNRADRTARDLAQEGLIRRIPDDRKIMMFGNTKEDVWEFI